MYQVELDGPTCCARGRPATARSCTCFDGRMDIIDVTASYTSLGSSNTKQFRCGQRLGFSCVDRKKHGLHASPRVTRRTSAERRTVRVKSVRSEERRVGKEWRAWRW